MLWDEPKIFFLERRYFFSIILSEFLKNRVALQQAWAEAMHPVYEDANMIAQYGVYLDKITEALGRS